MCPFYVAHEKGYFSEAGINVEVHGFQASSQVTPLVAAGEIDVAMIGLSPGLLNAVVRGARLSIVAAREMASPACRSIGTLYGNRNAFPNGLDDLSQLRGKRVAIRGRAIQSEFFLDKLLATAGLSNNDVQLTILRETEAVPALISGAIDVMLNSSFEFDVSELSADIVRGISVADILPGYQRAFIVFGPGLLDGDRHVGLQFLRAYLRGVTAYIEGATPKFLYELAASGGFGLSGAEQLCRENVVPDGQIDRAGIDTYVRWAVEKGYCPESASDIDFIDLSYLAEV